MWYYLDSSKTNKEEVQVALSNQEMKELYLSLRTEDEKCFGQLIGPMIYCMICNHDEPDQHIVYLNFFAFGRPKSEAFGKCETCGTTHLVTSCGNTVWYEKDNKTIRGVIPIKPEHPEDNCWRLMVGEREIGYRILRERKRMWLIA